jgi:hypothetical protein
MSDYFWFTAQVPKVWAPPWGHCWSSGGGGSCLHEGHFYLNEIWAEDKIYILVGISLG